MKKQFSFLIVIACLLLSSAIYAQVTSPNNITIIPQQYVGWSGFGPGGTKPLDIRNAWAGQPINFWTTGNPGLQRMTILANGQVGIGTTTPAPNAMLSVISTPIMLAGFPSIYDQEVLFRGTAADAMTDYFTIGNGTHNDGQFITLLHGHHATNGRTAISMMGTCPTANDAGTFALVSFDARRLDGNVDGAIINRPLFQWQSFTNIWMEMLANGRLGINNITPTNRLTITSTNIDPYFGTGNSSGLQFTNLTSFSNPVPLPPTTNVLSVDGTGNVILIPGGGTVNAANNGTSLDPTQKIVQLGNVTPGLPTAQLLNNREIPMGNSDLIFTGITPGTNRIGIGMPSIASLSPVIKLEVRGSISIYDGIPGSNNNGDNSLLFGREQTTLAGQVAADYGEWGIQYTSPNTIGNTYGGINFWKPFGSDGSTIGNGFGNAFLYLSDNGNVGIGTSSPVNKTEITSGVAATVLNPITAIAPTRSGLRFSNLNANMDPDATANPSGKVLSVNNTGDVILVPSPSFDIACPGYQLVQNSGIQLHNKNFYFVGQGSSTNLNSVGIGYSCGSTLLAKLDVHTTDQDNAGRFTVDGQFIPSSQLVGVNGSVGNSTAAFSIGVIGSASSSNTVPITGANLGVSATAWGASADNTGIYATASGATNNYGIKASGFGASFPAVFGNWGGVFQGKVFVNDPVTTLSTTIPSDRQLKKDTSAFISGLNVIRNIHPINYRYNGKVGLDTIGTYIGVIAEDLAQIAPYALDSFYAKLDSTDLIPTKFLTVKNEAIIYTSINAIKQLDSTISHISTTAENGLHIDTTAGNPVKLGGVLSEKTEIDMKNNLLFASDNNYPGQVCIGTSYTTQSEALVVNNKTWITSAKFINTKSNATDNVAASFLATGSSMNNYGGQFTGNGDDNQVNYGATFAATGKSKVNYGVYSTASGSGLNYAGYFNGNLYASSYLNLPSDSKLKENIQPLTNAMDIINQLQPKTFTFKAASFPSINLPAGQQYGLIAQDVSPILPTLVSTTVHPAVYDSVGNMVYDTVQSKSLNYEAFIPILIQGAKEQQSKIDSLKQTIAADHAQLDSVMSLLNNLTGNNGGNAKINSTINVELANDAVLYQNIPNPFAEETMINYYIPENTGNAKIIFFDMYGQSMKEVQLTETGSGNIHVDSKNLASGIYSYSLIINGKVIDTKKMVKSK